MDRRPLLGALAALAMVLMSGCAPRPEPPPLPVSGLLTVEAPVWRLDVRLVGDPVVRDGVVASYVRGGTTGLEVRAWSLADGRELWRNAALVGMAPEGVPLSLETVTIGMAPFVVFLARSDDWHPSELAVAGLATGTFRTVRSPAVETTSRLEPCGRDICFEGWSLDTQHLHEPSRPLRLDVDSGRIGFDPAEGPKGGFAIGDHLFATGGDVAQQLESTGEGGSWRRPYSGVFGAGSTTAGGWEWRQIGAVLVGVGGKEPTLRDHEYRSDFADTTVVGLDPHTGATRWHRPGTAPCPGTRLDTAVTGRVLELCRMRGSAVTPQGGDVADIVYRNVRMTRIGVDSRTGRILWSRPVPDAATAVRAIRPIPDWAGRRHPILERGRVLLLDRITGATAPTAPGALLLCRTVRPSVRVDPGRRADAGSSLDPCSGTQVSRGGLERAAISGGHGWWVVPGRTTLTVYSVG